MTSVVMATFGDGLVAGLADLSQCHLKFKSIDFLPKNQVI